MIIGLNDETSIIKPVFLNDDHMAVIGLQWSDYLIVDIIFHWFKSHKAINPELVPMTIKLSLTADTFENPLSSIDLQSN